MPDLSPLFPLILATHVTLAIALFVPSLLLPFTLRSRSIVAAVPADRPTGLVRALLWTHANGSVVIGAGLAVTGMSMLAVLGTRLLEQPWLLVSLSTYAAIAVVVFAFQRPRLRRLIAGDGVGPGGGAAAWQARARRQRYVAYAITSAVGLIAFLMSTKPELW